MAQKIGSGRDSWQNASDSWHGYLADFLPFYVFFLLLFQQFREREEKDAGKQAGNRTNGKNAPTDGNNRMICGGTRFQNQ